MIKFDDIAASIKAATNIYEKRRGIETLTVQVLDKKDDIAFFVAAKSDNTKSLYFAYRPNWNEKDINHWVWCCPNEEQVSVLTNNLDSLIKSEKPTTSLTYPYEKQIRMDDIKCTIETLCQEKINLKPYYSGSSIILYIAEYAHSRVPFIAFKPSKQYDKWYLFSPTKDQSLSFINDLSKYYGHIDSTNEESRGK
ncbi:Uncharacterised protein [uncultured archaeon]|nr:Uncharacterised protein [uncultured archaeon]